MSTESNLGNIGETLSCEENAAALHTAACSRNGVAVY